jgi:hypothetical protein
MDTVDRRFIYFSKNQFYFCQKKDNKLVKKVPISKEVAELIIFCKEAKNHGKR